MCRVGTDNDNLGTVTGRALERRLFDALPEHVGRISEVIRHNPANAKENYSGF